MKTISMDYKEYKADLSNAEHKGKRDFIKQIITAIKSRDDGKLAECFQLIYDEFDDDEPGMRKFIEAIGLRAEYDKFLREE